MEKNIYRALNTTLIYTVKFPFSDIAYIKITAS